MLKFNLSDVLKKIEGAKKIGLQLPDGLKFKCNKIAEIIENMGFEVLISGNTCYGACDIDFNLLNEVDYLLHFCHTPIFDIENVVYVPCYYEFEFDEKEIAKLEIDERKIALISTAQYVFKLEELKNTLERFGYEVELRKGSKRVKYRGQVLGCNYTVLKNTKAEAVLFVGDGLFHAIGASLYTGKKVYAYNPITNEFKIVKTDNFVKERYLAISKVLDRSIGAIIVSTKIGQKRMGLAIKLKKLAKGQGKKVDIIVLDNVNLQELGNFPYEFYVNTACPRITYDDGKYFKKPIITPQEFEIVLGLRDWENLVLDEIV